MKLSLSPHNVEPVVVDVGNYSACPAVLASVTDLWWQGVPNILWHFLSQMHDGSRLFLVHSAQQTPAGPIKARSHQEPLCKKRSCKTVWKPVSFGSISDHVRKPSPDRWSCTST